MSSPKAGIPFKSESLMKCLDTDLLVAILRGKHEAQLTLEKLDNEGRAATTSVNAYELYFGANKSERKKDNINETTKLLERLIVFPLNLSLSQKAAEISAELAAEGETIDFRDAMIGAISLENDLTLVTRNLAHFEKIKGLRLERW